jgi:hypothetical protein
MNTNKNKKKVILDYDEYHDMKTIAETKLKKHSIIYQKNGYDDFCKVMTNDKLNKELLKSLSLSFDRCARLEVEYEDVCDELRILKSKDIPWLQKMLPRRPRY